MKTVLSLILFVLSFPAFAQNNALFEDASTYYNEGKYQDAIANYLKILESDVHSAALYYNLGNAYYKLNQIAPSIYYYEKALQLAPNDADIQNNLLFAQNMTIDAIEPIPQPILSKLAGTVAGKLSYDTWGIVSVAFMILFVTGFLGYYFSARQRKKRLLFTLCFAFLMISALSFGAAYYRQQHSKNQRPAVIFEKELSVMSEPNNRSEAVFLLHEGASVNVQEALGDWKKIRLADGKTGWVPSGALKEIKDF